MPILPDTKDWTRVTRRPCPECGYDAAEIQDADVADALRKSTGSWPAVLAGEGVRERPNDSTWSPLEYGAHVRDVLRLYHDRLALMMQSDDPLYPNWDQDQAAIAQRYNEQDPATVSAEILDAAGSLSAEFEMLRGVAWDRRGRRSDGATFTVRTFSRYLLHDLVHHAWDVAR